jgi:disulfide bond formation protein DsbB
MLLHPRTVFLITLLVAVATLAAALIAQFGFGLKPCVLCLWQRLPYALLMGVAGVGLILKNRFTAPFLVVCVLLALTSAGLAFTHIGVEHHWWRIGTGCVAEPLGGKTETEVLAALLSTPQASCDEVAWKIFGFSITYWNAALSLVLALYHLLALKKARI